jgi:hypothetical protein
MYCIDNLGVECLELHETSAGSVLHAVVLAAAAHRGQVCSVQLTVRASAEGGGEICVSLH